MKKSKLPKPSKKGGKTSKKKYKIRNWHEYNQSLVNRGSLEYWIDKGIIKSWTITVTDENGKIIRRKRGAQKKYSDRAIEAIRLIGKVYHQRLRQTEGMVKSIFKQSKLNLAVPNFTTLCRRGVKLAVNIPKEDKENVAVIADSTGFKVYGEGEWKVRKHGYSKHREWVKLHISIDTDGEIRACQLTDNSTDDAAVSSALLDEQKEDHIDKFVADGAFDKKKVYQTCQEHQVENIIIPPCRGAKIWHHGNLKGEPHPRDENLRAIRQSTRKQWKIASGYHARSKVETTIFRAKTIFSEKLYSRTFEQQQTETALICKALNMMKTLGMPDSYPVT